MSTPSLQQLAPVNGAAAANPATIGRYRILRTLGTGGMGVVFAAHDPQHDRVIALKTLRKVDPAALYRFKRAFRAMADLTHPNLVTVYDLEATDECWYITMELLDGVTLLEHVRADLGPGEPLTRPSRFDRLRRAMRQLAAGVAALHEAHKVHRDLKPDNVLVTHGGQRVVIIDFGLVTDLHAAGDCSDLQAVGTAAYMAPEQAASRPVLPAADWYSLGVLLFEAMTGQVPFSGAGMEILVDKQYRDPPPASVLNPAVPDDLDVLCSALLSRNPMARPGAAEILETFGEGSDPTRLALGDEVLGWSTQTLPFVGREYELGILRRTYERRATDEAAVVVVAGESGVGKSALVSHFLELLRTDQPGAVVLAGRCYEREAVPFKAFDGIVDALSRYLKRLDQVDAALLLPDAAALLARMFPVLQRVPAIARIPDVRRVREAQHLRAEAFAAMRELLGRLAERRPLVVFVDDLHWADPDSLALLGEVMQAPDAPGLLFVAGVRTEPGASELPPALVEHVLTLGNVHHVEVKGLPPSDAVKLAGLLLDRVKTVPTQPRSVAEEVAREAGGHPLFIGELVYHLTTIRGSAAASEQLDEALWSRVSRLEPAARRLVELAAVAGSPVPIEVAAEAAELKGDEIGRLVALLRSSHLIRTSGGRATDTLELYHDRVLEAVLSHLHQESRVVHHRRLSDALQGTSHARRDPQILIRHLEAAGYTARAARAAEEAARVASAALAFDRAAELYNTALWLGDYDAEETRTLRLLQADALCNAGRGVEAAEVFHNVAEEARDQAMKLECQRRAAEQLLLTGHTRRGFEALELVLADIGVALPATPQRALVSLVWQRLKLKLRGLRWTARDASEVPARELTRLDVHAGVAASMAVADNIRGADFQARALLLALKIGEPRRLSRAIAMESLFRVSQSERSIALAGALVERIEQLAADSGDGLIAAWAFTARAVGLHLSGRFSDAAEALAEADQLFQRQVTGSSFELNTIRIFHLLALRALGRCRETRGGFFAMLRDAQRRGDRHTAATAAWAFNRVFLEMDDPERARLELERCAWPPPVGGFHLQHWYELRARIELDLYTGGVDGTFERLADRLGALRGSLLLRIRFIRTELGWARARVALAQADRSPDGPRGTLRAVCKLARGLEREEWAFGDLLAQLVRAGVAHQRGKREAAIEHLERAIRVAEANHQELHTIVAKRHQGGLLGGARGAALVAQADAWMREEGIARPSRMAAMIAPGFGPPAS